MIKQFLANIILVLVGIAAFIGFLEGAAYIGNMIYPLWISFSSEYRILIEKAFGILSVASIVALFITIAQGCTKFYYFKDKNANN